MSLQSERAQKSAVPGNPLANLRASKARVHGSSDGREPAWLLLNADVQEGLAALPSNSVHCVVTSPPYYWQRDYGIEGQIGHEPSIDGYVLRIRDSLRDLKRILRQDGTLFLNLGDTYYSAKGKPHGRDGKHRGRMLARNVLRAVDGPGLGLPRKSLIGIPWRVALALQQDGWTLRSDIVWQRPGSLPEPTAHDRPWNTHEHVFLFSRTPRYYFDRNELQGDEDVWHIHAKPDNPGAHFAPFPGELARRCILVGCPPKGIVLDPFAGSGTTLAEALRSNRSALGIELSPAYCDFIVDRLTATARNTVARRHGKSLRTPRLH